MLEVEVYQDAIEQADLALLAARFSVHKFEAPSVLWNPTDADLPDEKLRFLLAYWNGLRSSRDLPHYGLIDAVDLKPVLGFAALLEAVDGGADFMLRVYGSKIAVRSGFEINGKLMSQMPSHPEQVAFMLAGHRAVAKRREPLLSIHYPPRPSLVTSWTRLIVPFVNDESKVVRNLAVNHPGAWRTPITAW